MDGTKALACLMALWAAGCSRPAAIVVGSKNFTEQLVLGEVAAQQLERRGFRVDRKLNLGGTLLAHQALTSGAIDLYPEYSGTALTAVVKRPTGGDAAAVLRTVREEYRRQWGLEWLPPLGFDNTFAMVVRGETARAERLATLSDAARRAAPWRMGTGYEFYRRPDGFAGLVKTYGLRVAGTPDAMDLGLLYRALGSGQVEMAAGSATDGLLSVLDLTVLRDDKGYFPPYQCSLVVRRATLDRFPGAEAALAELSGRLTDPVIRRLNHEVDGLHRPPAEVARGFLETGYRR